MGYTDTKGNRAKPLKPAASGGRYNRSDAQKRELDTALKNYKPGAATAAAKLRRKKAKQAELEKLRRKSRQTQRAGLSNTTVGQGYSRNADKVYKDIKAGKYD